MTIVLYDTTLRDGTQREGMNLSADDKCRIALKLDELGIHYIEGGWPGSNPKDVDFFARARSLPLRCAVLTAFGSTCRVGRAADADDNLQAMLAAGTAAVAVFGKSWDLHVLRVLNADLDENVRMIADSVAYLRAHGREVIYDAEHFFDGYKADAAYALRTLRAAQEAGAGTLVLCDTNGGSLPSEVAAIVAAVRSALPTPLGIHAHNDAELAVANTLAAVQAGAGHVQGTINGYGERCGNANLCSIIPNLVLKLGHACVDDRQLRGLAAVSRYVSELANLSPDPHLPYVGHSAFAHKGGAHVNALLKCPPSYQHVDPGRLGNRARVVVSELSGKSNIAYKVEEFGLDPPASPEQVQQVLGQVKELENQGFAFEGAEGSVELMLRRAQPGYRSPFKLIDFYVLVESRSGGHTSPGAAPRGVIAEATVKVRVGDEVIHTAAEGNGPVSALDTAVRKALLSFYPRLANIHLVDYKVRILDGKAGTGAQVRVLIDSACGPRTWSTVGSSTNIIEASWMALADSLEYGLLNGYGT